MIKRGLLVTVSILIAHTASASINIDVVEVDNSANPILDGFRTFDLIITTDQHWTTSALYLDLQQGSLYQDPWENWGFYPPDLAVLQTLEQNGTPNGLEFDTYFGAPYLTQGWPATDVGAPPDVYQSNVAGITLSWGTPQTYFDNAGLASSGTQLAARITLSNDAEGTWSFGAIELGTPQAKFIGNPIAAGHMSYVPLQGDVTHDGFVGIEDLNNILGQWNLTVEPGSEYDPSGDGFTGIEDLNILLGNWNAGTPRRPILATPNPWGDLDGDGFVGYTDPKQLNCCWGLEVTPGDLADPSGDGFVGIDDLSIVMATYLQGAPPAVVPEPASVGVLGFGISVLIRRVRRN